jgi:tetratricopeptide (TPR) repeat protein
MRAARHGLSKQGRNIALTLLTLFALLAAGSIHLFAQGTDHESKALDPSQTLKGHQGAAIRVTVLDGQNAPLKNQALIKVHGVTQDATSWQVTGDKSQVLLADQPFGKYDIEVSALGYVSNRTSLDVASMTDTIDVKVVLQPDTSADLDNDSSLPPRALREVNRAIRALRADDLKEAQKRLDEAEKLSPNCARVKYLMGYLLLAKGDLPQAQALLEQATALNPNYARAWTLLGRLHLVSGRPKEAVAALQRAVKANPDSWVAHDLLADTYLEQHEYADARHQAELAVNAGERDSTAAQLALAEAAANLGKNAEAIAALKVFLNNNPRSIAVQHADELRRKLEQYKSKPIEDWSEFERTVAAFDIANDLVVTPKAGLPIVSWLPLDIDHNKPPVVAGLGCPAQQVIEGAGNRVTELIANVEKISAIETIDYERFDQSGNSGISENRKFDYAATVSQKTDVVLVDEYRSQRYDQNTMPDHIADNGFAVLALVFHPVMRDAFKMTCEGLGDWHGKPVWILRFQQREDKPNHMQSYLLGDATYPVGLKGRAWISADKFQIVRIETDMVKPMPQIELMAEHIVTEYAPVPFHKAGMEFWLPQTAEVYMHFRGQRYYHKHIFDKYMIFSVNAEDKVHEAKQDPEIPKSTNPKKHKFWPA